MELRNTLRILWAGICRAIMAIPKCLDWFVSVAERLIVLGITAVIFRFGYHLWSGALSSGENQSLSTVATNWKTILIVLIPLFYQTVRTFLEEVQEVWGMSRRPKQ